jgi:hypothetical protein
MYTKKVIIKWQKDSYLDCGTADREGAQSAALAELDAKTTAMIAEGKMSADAVVGGDGSTLISTKLFTDQAAADEWVAFNNTFATTYGFVKTNTVVLSV